MLILVIIVNNEWRYLLMLNAFTAGVKPGGLNTLSQIRILLCYLIKASATPLRKEEIEQALTSEQLVNVFELSSALVDLETNNLALVENGLYTLTANGIQVADTLATDVPKTVRESAVSAVIKAQGFLRKSMQHKASIELADNGYNLNCYIEDISDKLFSFTIYLPDLESAELAKQRFIENGDKIYSLMLAGLTGNLSLAAEYLK